MTKLLLFTCVSEEYQGFIPWYVLGAQQTYPEYDITIALDSPLNPEVEKALEAIGSRARLLPNSFPRKPGNKNWAKTWRWLFNIPDASSYDCIYIGDIDIILCKEGTSLLRQHTELMNKHGLPYSNVLKLPEKRLGGLHFYHQQEWHRRTSAIVSQHTDYYLKFAEQNPKASCEYALYDIAARAGLIPNPSPLGLGWRKELFFHGIHLGRFRSLRDDSYQDDWHQFKYQVPEIVCTDKGKFLLYGSNLGIGNEYVHRMLDVYDSDKDR